MTTSPMAVPLYQHPFWQRNLPVNSAVRYCRLSLRERTRFRGAKGEKLALGIERHPIENIKAGVRRSLGRQNRLLIGLTEGPQQPVHFVIGKIALLAAEEQVRLAGDAHDLQLGRRF